MTTESDLAPGILPYFVDGEDCAALGRKEAVELTARTLLFGILVSWFEVERFTGAEDPETLRRLLNDLLEALRRDFGCDSLETLILDAAAVVRARHGALLASRMLTAGNNLLPGSARIRGDLMVDVWRVLEATEPVDRPSAFAFLVKVYRGIDLAAVDGRVVELLDYIYLVALSFRGQRDERARFFRGGAAKRVRNAALKRKMLALLADPDPDFENYRIGSNQEDGH